MFVGALFWFFLLAVPWECCGSCRNEEIQSPMRHYNYYKNVITKLTIICSQIFSMGQISYKYDDTNFDKLLVISNSSIFSIHPMEIYKFRDFVTLKLDNIHIRSIAPGSFSDLTKLRELYLDNNELTVIQSGVFSGLTALKILNLTNNNIAKTEDSALTGLLSLTQLYLRNNKLTSLNSNFFKTLDNLKYVDFTGNPLESFPFSELPETDTLILSSTSLTKMPDDLSNLTMETFDLSFSQITKVDFCLFPKSNETNLKNNKIVTFSSCRDFDSDSLNLDNNAIEKIIGVFGILSKLNLGHNKLQLIQKSLFGHPSSLNFLDLRSNNLSIFAKNFFHDFTSLKTLILQNNKIKKIDPILFRNLTRLVLLDLSSNLIEDFQFGVFDSLANLEVLNISANKLTTLPHDRFHSLSSLLHLLFANNQISAFEVSGFVSLQTVSLDHNPWKCQELVKIANTARQLDVEILRGNSFDEENFRGIACENSRVKNTETSVREDVEEAIGDEVRNSKIKEVFNEGFENSKFVRYFDGDFSKSKFFEYLSNFKFVVEKKEVNGSRSEKLTAFQEGSTQGDHGILVLNSFVLIFILLVQIIFVILYFVKKNQREFARAAVSEIELC